MTREEENIRYELRQLTTYRIPLSNTDLVTLKSVERVLNLVFRGHRDLEPKAEHEPKTDILDEIMTEIEQVKSIMNEEIINHDRKDLINFINGINQCLVIIDRYRRKG